MRVVALFLVVLAAMACRGRGHGDVDELARDAKESLELLAKLDPARSDQYQEGIRTIGRAAAVVRSIDVARKMRPRLRAFARVFALVRRYRPMAVLDDARWIRESSGAIAILAELDRKAAARPARRRELERSTADKLVGLLAKRR